MKLTLTHALAVIVLASSFVAAPVAAGPFEDAAAAYLKGDYATARQLFRPLAEQGNAAAQFSLGDMYFRGQGVPQNYAEAMKWFRLAADQGDSDAQSNLGFIYSNGQGVPQNYTEAMKWYRLAANQGSALGEFNLGVIYQHGQGVPQNYAEAVKWYRLAANQGDSDAQSNLGGMYFRGQGVPQDYVRAHMWFNLSAASGNKGAATNRDIAARRMTATQIAEAQKLAHDQGQCAAEAKKAYAAHYNLGFMKMDDGYTRTDYLSHYNVRLNKCLILLQTTVSVSGAVVHGYTLFDAVEGTSYGNVNCEPHKACDTTRITSLMNDY